MRKLRCAAVPLKVEIMCSRINGGFDSFIVAVVKILNFEAKKTWLAN
jgi:hypothetical protein